MTALQLHQVSIFIPVYAGKQTLLDLMDEITPLKQPQTTPAGRRYRVAEVLLVHDRSQDRSDKSLEALAPRNDFVPPVWLSKNCGQHAATLAGMASATGDWEVTIDQDRQQDPADIGGMLAYALDSLLQFVYAQPVNIPHGRVKSILSKAGKATSTPMLGNRTIERFNSFLPVDNEIAWTPSECCRNGVYLDVGLFWIVGRTVYCTIHLRHGLGPGVRLFVPEVDRPILAVDPHCRGAAATFDSDHGHRLAFPGLPDRGLCHA